MAHLFKKFRKKPKSKANVNSTKFYKTVSDVNDNFSVSQNDSCAKTVSESIRSQSSHTSNVSRTSDDSNELTVYWKQPRYERTTKNPIFINEPVDFYEDYHNVTLERRCRLRNIGSFPNGNITRESIANLPRAFSMGNLYPWNNNSGYNEEGEVDKNKIYIELQKNFQKRKSESDISTSLNGISKKLSKKREQSLPDLFSSIDQPISLTQSSTFPSYSSYSSLPLYSKNADSGVFQSTDDDIEIHEDVENLLQASNAQSGSRIIKRRSDETFINSISRFDGLGADSLPVDGGDHVNNEDDIDYSASVDAVLKDLENSLDLSDDDISFNNDDVRVSRESLSYWASSESIISDDDSRIKVSGAWYQKRGKRKSESQIDFSSDNNFIDDIDDILDPSILQPPRRSFSTPVETRKRTSNVSFLSLGIKHQKLKSDEIFFHVEKKISDVQSKLNKALESKPNDNFQEEFAAKHKEDIEMKKSKLAEAVTTQNMQSITDTLSESKTDDYSSDNNIDTNNNIVKKKRKHVNILKTVNTKPKEVNIASKPYAVKVMLETVQNVQSANKSKNKSNHSELFRSRLDQFEQKTSTSGNATSDKPTVRNKQSFNRTSNGSYVLSAAHVNLKSGFSDTDKQSDVIFKSREDLEVKASDSKLNVKSLVNDIESDLNVDAETIEKEKLARKISKKMNVTLPRGASANLPIISTTNEESSRDEDYVDSYLSVQSNVNTRTPTGLTILRRESTIFRRPKKTIEDILMEGADVYPDRACKRTIMSLMVRCYNYGNDCDWTGELANLQTHIEQCQLVPVNCVNACGRVDIPRNQMAQHTDSEGDCPLALVNCRYADVACKYKARRCEMDQHLKENVEKHLELAHIRIRELEVRQENICMNGKFLWKISNYDHLVKQSATKKEKEKLCSPPFYTGQYGYKLRAEAFLNGLGQGKGSHLSLYVVIMKGEYDAILPWPFKQNVDFVLMDQDDDVNNRQNKVWKLSCERNSDYFKRPNKSKSLGFGCPKFVSLETLRTKNYIKDQTLFIKIEVEPTDGLIFFSQGIPK